jgi:hypothetical protein
MYKAPLWCTTEEGLFRHRFNEVSVNKIVEKAGVAKGTFNLKEQAIKHFELMVAALK